MKQTTKMSRTLGTIEAYARKINEKWFNNELDMNQCIFTVTNQKKSYGFFTPYNSFNVFDKEGDRQAVQISIDSLSMSRNIEDLISTLIHELVHYFNYTRGVKDVSRGNRYHNRIFKAEAEKRGLIIGYDSTIGYSLTSPSDELIEWILEEGFEEIRLQEIDYTVATKTVRIGTNTNGTTVAPIKPKKSSTIKLICPHCNQRARVTNPNHNIVCGECMVRMIEIQ